MFELMETVEQVYREGGEPYKTTTREDANCTSHFSKRKVGEAVLSTNPKNIRTSKHKKHYTGHPSNGPTGDKICLVHGPGHSTTEYKVLKEYSNNYEAQRPHK